MLAGKLTDTLCGGFQVRFHLNKISLEELVLLGLNEERVKMFGYLEIFVSEFYFSSALLILMCICLHLQF